jgi:hypothetical protein
MLFIFISTDHLTQYLVLNSYPQSLFFKMWSHALVPLGLGWPLTASSYLSHESLARLVFQIDTGQLLPSIVLNDSSSLSISRIAVIVGLEPPCPILHFIS